MNNRTRTSRHLRFLGVSITIGLSMLLLVPEHVEAKGRGFGRGYHGGFQGRVQRSVYGGRTVRGGYARGVAAGGLYAGGYGTGTDSTRYAMYSARNPVTQYTGIPTGANPGIITKPGLVMAQKQADQQYLAALEQARTMDAAQRKATEVPAPQGRMREEAMDASTENAGPPPVGTIFSSVLNAQTVTIDDKTYFVSNGVYFQAFYQGSDIVYKVVEAPKTQRK